ncbi:MAG: LysR family transcriptional regulator [Oligoflexia bacterium]|nr:LysR family transcriptional regulator [Oligoflexia bacterium]
MKWLNYHHFFYFWTIVREGSISRAAEKLRIGQPALSMQLKQFEQASGHVLVERKKGKLALTPAGKAAFDYAEAIFRLGEQFQDLMRDEVFSARPHIQLGILDGVSKFISAALIEFAWKNRAGIVTIAEGSHDELMRDLASHRVDLVLSNHPPASVRNTQVLSKRLSRLPVAIFGHRRFEAARKNFPESLSGYPLIFPTHQSRLRGELDHYFSLMKLSLRLVAEVQDTSMQHYLGRSGHGLVPLPDTPLITSQPDFKMIRLGTLPNVFEEIWVMKAKRRIATPLAEELFARFSLD